MRRFLTVLDRAIIALLIFVLSVMVVVGAMQVFWRYILGTSLSWSEELMRYLYVWATMLGVCIAIRRKSFACIDNFLDLIGAKVPAVKYVLQVVSVIVQIFVFALFIIYGHQFTIRGLTQHSPAMTIAMAYIYAAFPVGGMLGMLYTFEEIYDTFIHKPETTGTSPEV